MKFRTSIKRINIKKPCIRGKCSLAYDVAIVNSKTCIKKGICSAFKYFNNYKYYKLGRFSDVAFYYTNFFDQSV